MVLTWAVEMEETKDNVPIVGFQAQGNAQQTDKKRILHLFLVS